MQDGDSIFKRSPQIVNAVLSLSPNRILPSLVEMLYVHDSGMHEACTVFGVILKIGNQHPEIVIGFLEKAIESDTVPHYYAKQLIEKIRNRKFKEAYSFISKAA